MNNRERGHKILWEEEIRLEYERRLCTQEGIIASSGAQ